MENVNIEKQTLATLTYDMIKKSILEGQLLPGEKLASEVQFSKEMNVSRPILREALQKLATDGYITRKHGIGTFVAKNRVKLEPGIEKLDSITDFVTENKYKIETKITKKLSVSSNQEMRELLNLSEDEVLYSFERIRFMEANPFAVDYMYIPQKYIDKADFETYQEQSILGYFDERSRVTITASNCSVYAENIDEKTADNLNINVGEAIQVLEQVFYDDENTPIFHGKSWIVNEYMSFRLVRRR